MDEEITRHLVQQQLDRLLRFKELLAYHGWKVKLDGLNAYVLMYPKKHPELKFMARFYYGEYPKRAPTLTFVEPQTLQESKQFWPQNGSAFQAALGRNPPQLCIYGIREFHEILHKEHPWDLRKYPLLKVLEDVQIELDKAYP